MCVECFSVNAATPHAAGRCDVFAPDIETPGLAWNYWWSGECAGGFASGRGFLFEYMKDAGFGDIYAVRMERGKAVGTVVAYGSTFLGAEWFIRSGEADASGEWPDAWRGVDAYVPRHALPQALQEAIVRFAHEVGHAQIPAMPVIMGAARCLPEGAQAVQSQGGFDAARKSAFEDLLRAAANNADVRPQLRIATAIAGCRERR